ncbi:MAG: phosphate/phosphite/phosphonate ABC transporter substrate-binding protein [Burkholderiales bacterium]|nr:phosphate/phosphite/phosphonate ABC transporter substrate-binding protein [Sulfuricellaceae bacterium]
MGCTIKNKPSWTWLVKAALPLLATACLAVSAHAAAHTYTFAVVPQFEQRKLFAIWKPIVDELEKRTGLSFKLVATLTIQNFERELSKGSFDFVYTNPYHILMVSQSQGYIPLVRDETPLRGILVVRKDSPIQDISELEGKTVAFPSANAIGASLLMRADLSRLYHVTVVPLYVKTHSSVYFHVVNGLTAAGGGVEKTLHEQDASVQEALRVLYTTREIPSHPIAAHPRISKALRDEVQQALLEMSRTREGQEWLDKVPIHKMVATSMADYTPMLSWGLESLWEED